MKFKITIRKEIVSTYTASATNLEQLKLEMLCGTIKAELFETEEIVDDKFEIEELG